MGQPSGLPSIRLPEVGHRLQATAAACGTYAQEGGRKIRHRGTFCLVVNFISGRHRRPVLVSGAHPGFSLAHPFSEAF